METSNIIYLRRIEERKARQRARAERRARLEELTLPDEADRSLLEFYRQEAET